MEAGFEDDYRYSLTKNGSDAISDNATCLRVIIDRELTFATHVLRLSSRRFYQLRQLCTIRNSLNEEATKVHALVVCRLN